MSDQIDFCRENRADFIVASLHWGYEYEFFPRSQQQDITHEIIELGADAIIGHHSQFIQPVEYYSTERDPDRTAIIAYSLGNPTSSFSAPALVLSQILNLTLTKGFKNGQKSTCIESLSFTPVVQLEAGSESESRIEIAKFEDLKSKESAGMNETDRVQKRNYVKLVLGVS